MVEGRYISLTFESKDSTTHIDSAVGEAGIEFHPDRTIDGLRSRSTGSAVDLGYREIGSKP